MTVAELIEELNKMPQDAEVLVLGSYGDGWDEPKIDLRENGKVYL